MPGRVVGLEGSDPERRGLPGMGRRGRGPARREGRFWIGRRADGGEGAGEVAGREGDDAAGEAFLFGRRRDGDGEAVPPLAVDEAEGLRQSAGGADVDPVERRSEIGPEEVEGDPLVEGGEVGHGAPPPPAGARPSLCRSAAAKRARRPASPSDKPKRGSTDRTARRFCGGIEGSRSSRS